MNIRQINRARARQFVATGRGCSSTKGTKLCSCCCEGSVKNEKRAIKRARRREGRAIVMMMDN